MRNSFKGGGAGEKGVTKELWEGSELRGVHLTRIPFNRGRGERTGPGLG